MERTQAIKDFIREHKALFWYSPGDKGETVSDELLVESVLNYGNMDDVRKLFEIMSIYTVAAIFRQMMETGRKRLNYFPEVSNYFELYFDKYAPRNS
jgi:Cys-tRNA synthase (O-phospho-L-seryl-tRNA:Cys-tRNA synthase)